MFEEDEAGRSWVCVGGQRLLNDCVVVEGVAGKGVVVYGESVCWEVGNGVRSGVGGVW